MFWCWKGTLYHCIWKGVPFFNSSRSLQRPESGKIKMLNRSHNSVVVIFTIHVDRQQKMKQGPSLAIGRLFFYREGFWGERVAAYWEIGTWKKYMRLVHSFCGEGNPRSQQILMVLACSSCFAAWPFAELLDEGCSFNDFVCMLCSALRGKIVRKNPKHTVAWDGQMKADIASAVGRLTEQPRAVQKHARLLVTMQKRIVGQRPAVGACCTMLNTLNTQTSHSQICSLWSSNSYEQYSPSVFSLNSCDGKIVSQDIGVSELDFAECSVVLWSSWQFM